MQIYYHFQMWIPPAIIQNNSVAEQINLIRCK